MKRLQARYFGEVKDCRGCSCVGAKIFGCKQDKDLVDERARSTLFYRK